MNTKIAIVFLQLFITTHGEFDLACDPVNPSAQTNVTCVCRRTVGSAIKWFFNGISISDCFLNLDCFPKPLGYIFSINVSEFAYEMTKSAYDYNDCTQINCTDASNTSVQLMVVPSAIKFDPSNPAPISEPALSHSNGKISITTGCISGYKDVTCNWYTVHNGVQEKYTYGQSAFDTFNTSCTNCNDDDNAKKTCGFYHIEASGNETKNVNFRVVLTHKPTNLKSEVDSANVYTVKDSNTMSITNPGTNATDSSGHNNTFLKNSSTPNHPIMTSSATMQHTALYIGFSSMMFIFIVVIPCYFCCLKLIPKGKSNTEFERERDENSENINVLNSTQL